MNICRVLSQQTAFSKYGLEFLKQQQDDQDTAKDAESQKELRLSLLQIALRDTFVELDKEICSAKHEIAVPTANQPYLDDYSWKGLETITDIPKTSSTSSTIEWGIDDPGTTVCVVLLTPEFIVCANAGDTRAVLSTASGGAVSLSHDHKPSNELEKKRIEAAGGYVCGGRVDYQLSFSRGLGLLDFKVKEIVLEATKWEQRKQHPSNSIQEEGHVPPPPPKQAKLDEKEEEKPKPLILNPEDQKVSPILDIIHRNRNSVDDKYILIASDGIWEKWSLLKLPLPSQAY